MTLRLNREPQMFCCGDSLWYVRHLPEMPSEQGWFLEDVLYAENGNIAVPLFRSVENTNNPNDASHEFQVNPFAEGLDAGNYTLVSCATNGTYRHEIYRGLLILTPNYANGEAMGDQTPYELKMVRISRELLMREMRNPIIESDVQRMRFQREKREALRTEVCFWEERYKWYLDRQKIRNGQPDPSLIRVAFDWPAC